MIRVTFRPGLTLSGPVTYQAESFCVEEDESISLLDADEQIIAQIHSGVWEDVVKVVLQ